MKIAIFESHITKIRRLLVFKSEVPLAQRHSAKLIGTVHDSMSVQIHKSSPGYPTGGSVLTLEQVLELVFEE